MRIPAGRNPANSRSQQRPDLEPEPIEYFDSQGQIRPELLDSKAREFAKQLADKINKTQLRRYYNDVVQLQRRLELMAQRGQGPQAREQAFARLRAEFKMLKAKAYYANGRSSSTFPNELLQFFVTHTHRVNSAREFDAFYRHFQAVVAFHQYYGKEER